MADFKIEFPDFPAAEMPLIPEGFVDTSWVNDACPCFTSDKLGLTIWVDREDPAKREYAETSRFMLTEQDRGVEVGSWSFSTDDWDDLLKMIAERSSK